MPLKFMLGRSGSGKTTTVIQRIIDQIKEQPDGPPILLLVPEQASFQAQYALIRTPELRGNVRAHTYGFRHFAEWILRETGGSARTPIGDEGKKMLLYKLIHAHQPELRLFGASSDQFGFIGKLSELYTEFKHHALTAEELARYVQQPGAQRSPLLSDKLHDLQRIYQEYEQGLAGLYVDRDDTLTDLAAAIPQSETLNHVEVWIDGFHSFSPQEYAVIAALMEKAASVTITLTLDRPYDQEPPQEMELFHPTALTYRKLAQLAEALDGTALPIIENLSASPDSVPVRFRNSAQLAHLEYGYRHRKVWREPSADQAQAREQDITIHSTLDRRSEIEAALREMIRLARDKGARWRDMALFVRTLDDYESMIEPLLQDYNIPYFMDKRQGILHHPLAEFLRSALDIVMYHWRYEDVFRCIKTGMLVPDDGRVSTEDIDRLENAVLATGIHGSRWTDGRPWRNIPGIHMENEEERTESQRAAAQRIEQARDLVTGPLITFEKKIKKARHATEMCIALYQLIEDCNIAGQLEQMSGSAALAGDPLRAREHVQIYGSIMDLLEQMVDIMGEGELELTTFAGLLETGLSGLRLGIIPPAMDQVLIGSMDRTRPMDIRYAFVLGVNDGIVPSVFVDDGILNEMERTSMSDDGLALAPGITRRQLDERFLIYNTLTMASDKLWISYSQTDHEGKGLLPSEVITQVRSLFPFLQHQHHHPSAEQESDRISHPATTLPLLIGQLRDWSRGSDMQPAWWHAYNWYTAQSQWQPQLHMLLDSLFYENRGRQLNEDTSRHLYGSVLRTSVSGMEQFVSCPFAHFAARGLKLRERQEYRLKAPDISKLFYASLTDLAKDLKSQGRKWGDLSPEECMQAAEAAVDKHVPRLQGEILFSSKRYGYITRKLREIVSRASVIIGEQSRRGDFEPWYLELVFGPNGDWPPLRFTLDNGCTMEIVGKIDRVDVAESDNGLLIRIIDYKSSQTDLKLHEVYYGLALQMLTYLDVLLTHAEDMLGQKASPAGALYFHVHNPLLQSGNRLTLQQSQQELLKKFKMKGLLLADRDVIGRMDMELDKGYSAILPVAVKTDGGFYSSSAVASPDQWDELLRNVRQTARDIGTGITDGQTDITPYRMEQEKACTFCSYKSVCQFDESVKGNAYNILKKPNKNETWELLQNQQSTQKGDHSIDQ
ncbi:helicase-exonuclease AddAB subunit AddB [Paenibacillus bovis]|uniref:ATP-dependent helicase/deoxyribonuclease subunit B n=1 Tax=Paenibacillus bovis TaxID=1616788 RepID=A0A172ZJC4_9BACL|nr:helicase-exonuclease AddAB subunit AddB [Paenibacillus bovis]ANF97745.1 helicase-exonuclease AddAB subunit AddB [Paenibacillus bovis]